MFGKVGVCDHHKRDIRRGRDNKENKIGAANQFIGDKCGIEIYLL